MLVQIADFIAGSLARMYDPKKFSARAEDIHDLLRAKARFVIDWPKRFRSLPPPLFAESSHDERVRRYCLERVWEYLDQHEGAGDPDIAARVEALHGLLFWYEAEGRDAWIATAKLTEAEPPHPRNQRPGSAPPCRQASAAPRAHQQDCWLVRARARLQSNQPISC
jgi:hypothetical protein